MKKEFQNIFNSILLFLILFVILDHFMQWTYMLFFADNWAELPQGYMEILSLIVTIAVPAFYTLHKQAENKREEEIIVDDETRKELKQKLIEVRKNPNTKSKVYYSLAGISLITCLFFQSTVLNAEKIESAKQQTQMDMIINQLKEVHREIQDNTVQLREVIADETSSWTTMRKKLASTLAQFESLETKVGGAVVAVEASQHVRRSVDLASNDIEKNIKSLLLTVNSFEQIVNESFHDTRIKLTEIDQKINGTANFVGGDAGPIEVDDRLKAMDAKIDKLLQKLNDFSQQPSTLVLSPQEQLVVNGLVEILNSYEKSNGQIPELSIGVDSKQFFPQFRNMLDEKYSLSISQFHNKLIQAEPVLQKVELDVQAAQKDLNISNLKDKVEILRWLKWRSGF